MVLISMFSVHEISGYDIFWITDFPPPSLKLTVKIPTFWMEFGQFAFFVEILCGWNDLFIHLNFSVNIE